MQDTAAILAKRLAAVRERMAAACQRAGRDPSSVTLIAVTKTVSASVAALLPTLGVHDLGESRPQALWEKAAAIPEIRWHMIGHLQRNKLDKTVPLLARMHTVDSLRLLESLNESGIKRGIVLPVLLEVNCSREEAKGGFAPAQIPIIAEQLATFAGVRVDGFMTMAAYSDDPLACRPTFAELRTIRDDMQTRSGLALPQLSMGMSNDFEAAIEEGATFIRVGSTLFEGLGETT